MGILDIFIERTDDEPKKDAPVKNTVPTLDAQPNQPYVTSLGTAPAAPVTPSYVAPQPGISAEDLKAFDQHFDELFDQANLPGPDYYEFAKMCQAMSALPDNAKLPAAFSGLAVQGLTKQRLVESAAHYIAIIDEDATKFNSAIDAKILGEVKKKRAEIEEKKKKLQEKIDLIAKLQAELATDNSQILSLGADADADEQKATLKSNTYKAACEARKAQINGDVTKINTFIA
jgi:hypothetical protein